MLSTVSRLAKFTAIATLTSGTLFMSGAPAMAVTGTTVASVVTKDSKPAGHGTTKHKTTKHKRAKHRTTKHKRAKHRTFRHYKHRK